MEEVYKKLVEHLNNSTEEQLRKDFEKLKEYNNIGPTCEEYFDFVEQYNKNK